MINSLNTEQKLKKQSKLLTQFSIISFTAFFSLFCSSTYKEPNYKVIKSEEKNDIEIREYPSLNIAEIRMKGYKDHVMNDSFRILFRYITGKNEKEQEIEMTAPVLQKQTGTVEWSMSFIIPAQWKLEDIPQPKNGIIKIKQIEQRKMAVIRFFGRASQRNFFKYRAILEDYLSKNNIVYQKKDPIFAYYNSPWTIWFLKRQEVMFQIID